MYLGASPKHARSVYLILNIETGLVSPQFYVHFDNLFETVKDLNFTYNWKVKCHFKEEKKARNPLQASNTSEKVIPALQDMTEPPSHIVQHQDNQPDVFPTSPTEIHNHQADSTTTSNQDQEMQPTIHPAETETLTATPNVRKSRYGRIIKPTIRAIESKQQQLHGTVAYQSTDTKFDVNMLDYLEHDKTQDLDNPITFALKASNDPYTLYMHEALCAHDADHFREAMVREVNEHTKQGNWELVLKQDLPPDTKVLPAIWAMKRKWRIDSRKVYKWKSRLNLGGHKMLKGVHYEETYSPVVMWQLVRIFLILGTINKWKTRQLDFVMAYT
jgi:Reverse transcriptase (RNA-dependent DNA polymerase)